MENVYLTYTRNVLIIGFAYLLKSLSGIILLPIIAKGLGTSSYGIWSQMKVTVNLMAPIICLALPYAMVRYLAAETDKIRIRDDFYSIVTAVLLMGCVSILVAVILERDI